MIRGAAGDWLMTLDEEGVKDYDGLCKMMIRRYGRSDLKSHLTAKELFETKQKVGESVETYIAAQYKRAMYLGKEGEKMALYSILAGLRPQIASFVAQKQPKNMKELLEAARLAEIATVKEADETALEKLQSQMTQLMTAMNNVTTAQISARRDEGERRDERRVTFYDRRSPSPGSSNNNNNYTRQQPQQQSSGLRQRGGGGGYRPYNRGRGRGGRWTNATNGQQDNNTQCGRCGRYNHPNPQICPAMNDICHWCTRRGHHKVMCRAWLRTQKFEGPSNQSQ
jgi:hypothetical protein